jgi:hypothetical protein
MTWKRTEATLTEYAAPSYFYPKYPFAASGGQSVVHSDIPDSTRGAIANDGTVNSLAPHDTVFNDWMNHDSAAYSPSTAASASMSSVKVFNAANLAYNSFPGAILDKDRALFVEVIHPTGGTDQYHLWLKEDSTQTDLSFMPPQPVDLAAISLAPNLKTHEAERLWSTTGASVFLEKRAGGSGASRWHPPQNMAEGAIRMNARGEAITAGQPDETTPVPPKLWRNGKYSDLNDVAAKPAAVQITEAIDLASNDIILVQATEGGVKKTGLLVPVEVVNKDGVSLTELN